MADDARGTTTAPPAPSRGPDEDPVLPQLGAVGLARFAWRQLTSMRTALFLLLMLSIAALPGSVFPQRGIDAAAVAQYLQDNPTSGPWLDRLGFFDVYASPWFSAVYLLLFVSLVGCVLPRARVHWAAVRARPVRTPRRLERMPAHETLEVDGDPAAVLTAARGVLRRRRYRADVREDDGQPSVSAERGYLRETGNVLFHLSLVGLLVAVAAGSLYGYRGEALVTTGGTFTNTLVDYDSIDPGTLFEPEELPPFQVTLDDLEVSFEEQAGGNQFAAPRDFTARVTVVDEPGAEPRRETIRVNEPLSVGSANVYLSGNGYAPLVTVRDGNGDVAFSGAVPFLPVDAFYSSTGVVKAPDARPEQVGVQALLLPTFVLDEQGPRSVFPDARDPRMVLTAWVGDLGLDDGVPQSVFRLDTEGLTQLTADDGDLFRVVLAPGQTVELPDGHGSITFEDLTRFAAVDVRHDPGKVPALVFAVLAMVGLVASLFVRRRRLWVRVLPASGPGRTVVQVAGLARGDDPGLADEVRDVARALGEAADPRLTV
ncbi:cytochrome c biogenesis protein ResB [Thalassiella azotivora]